MANLLLVRYMRVIQYQACCISFSANASKTLLFYLQLPWCVGAAAVVENTTNFHFNGSLGGLLGGVVVAAAAFITKLVAQQPADG